MGSVFEKSLALTRLASRKTQCHGLSLGEEPSSHRLNLWEELNPHRLDFGEEPGPYELNYILNPTLPISLSVSKSSEDISYFHQY